MAWHGLKVGQSPVQTLRDDASAAGHSLQVWQSGHIQRLKQVITCFQQQAFQCLPWHMSQKLGVQLHEADPATLGFDDAGQDDPLPPKSEAHLIQPWCLGISWWWQHTAGKSCVNWEALMLRKTF